MNASELLEALLNLKEDNPAIFDNMLIDIVNENLYVYTVDKLKVEKLFNKIEIWIS